MLESPVLSEEGIGYAEDQGWQDPALAASPVPESGQILIPYQISYPSDPGVVASFEHAGLGLRTCSEFINPVELGHPEAIDGEFGPSAMGPGFVAPALLEDNAAAENVTADHWADILLPPQDVPSQDSPAGGTIAEEAPLAAAPVAQPQPVELPPVKPSLKSLPDESSAMQWPVITPRAK